MKSLYSILKKIALFVLGTVAIVLFFSEPAEGATFSILPNLIGLGAMALCFKFVEMSENRETK